MDDLDFNEMFFSGDFEEEPRDQIEKKEEIQKFDSYSNPLAYRLNEAGIELDEGQKEALSRYSSNMAAAAHASAVMSCKGNQCPAYDSCPLVQAGIKLPLSKKCPVELSVMDDVLRRFCEGLDINPDTPAGAMDLMQVWEIARHEIMEFRASGYLAKNPDIIVQELKNVGVDGTHIHNSKINEALLFMQQVSRTKNKIRQELLATRKAQIEAGRRVDEELKDQQAIIAKAEKLKKLLEERSNNHG